MADEDFPVALKIERYFERLWDRPYNLSMSYTQPMKLDDLLAMSDPECLDLWNNMLFSYTDMAGHPLLRQEVAKLHGVSADDVLEVVPIEGIFLAINCLVRYIKKKHNIQNFHAVTTAPAYQSLQENLRMADCQISDWTARRHSDKRWYFDLDDLKQELRENTKLIVVNFPHNPTGACPGPEEWRELVQLCSDREIFLFSDEMYRLSNLDDSCPLPSASSQNREWCVSLAGLSKVFGMPGVRVGWLCTRNAEILTSMKRLKDYTTLCGSVPSEILAVITLRNKDRVLKRTREIASTNLQLYEDFFKQYPDLFDWSAPSASTIGLLEVKGRLLELGEGGASGFCEVLQRQTGIVMLPCSVFDLKPDIYIRLGFGLDSVHVSDALRVLKGFLDKHI